MNQLPTFMRCIFFLLFLYPLVASAQPALLVERCHSFPEKASVNCLHAEGERIWLGTSEGLYMYSYATNRRNILEDVDVIALTRDSMGRMWVALRDGRVMSTDRQRQFSLKEQGFAPYVTQMESAGGKLWIATAEKGLYIWDLATMEQEAHLCSENGGLLTNTVNCMASNEDGGWLLGTDKGVLHLNGTETNGVYYAGNVTACTTFEGGVYFLSDSKLWTWKHGVEGHEKWNRELLPQAIRKGLPRDITLDKEGRLYVASNHLVRYVADADALETFGPAEGFVTDKSLCLTTDGNGDVWVGTSHSGLYRFKQLEPPPPADKPAIMPQLQADRLKAGATLAINQLFFQADSTNFDTASVAALEELYVFLEKHPNIRIEIGGHTNNLPPDYYCDKLSGERAKSVAAYLYRRGIPQSQVSHKGYGKRKPVASNASAKGRRQNQRVEIKVLSVE